MSLLVILRHGQSIWNLENRFTGEVDVPLTDKGREEAHIAGKSLINISFNYCFTSMLARAQETLEIILEEIHQQKLPVKKDRALNERNYGDLQGLNKSEMIQKYGEQQVTKWRRSYAIQPPNGESLEDTAARVIPFYKLSIEPLLKLGSNCLIVAHGNSLRALMMYLENIDAEGIAGIELATGKPRIYSFDDLFKLISITST